MLSAIAGKEPGNNEDGGRAPVLAQSREELSGHQPNSGWLTERFVNYHKCSNGYDVINRNFGKSLVSLLPQAYTRKSPQEIILIADLLNFNLHLHCPTPPFTPWRLLFRRRRSCNVAV
jgi:hypothetical protein